MRLEVDNYGYRTYYFYRPSDNLLVRQVKTLTPFVNFNNLEQIATAERSSNANYLITDYELDEAGQMLAMIDPRGIRHEMEYDSRARMTAKVEAVGSEVEARMEKLYDAQSNLIEERHPRYFDENDTNGYQQCHTTYTYTRRNFVKSMIDASSSNIAATVDYSYYDDGLLRSQTDPYTSEESASSAVKTHQRLWHICCGRPQAQIDQDGHGEITNNDFYGNITHIINVSDVLSHSSNYHDPINSKTVQEVTKRFDSRHRLVAQTLWLSPLGEVDPNDVPIATNKNQGLTTTYEYFDEVIGINGLITDSRLQKLYEQLVADGVVLTGNANNIAIGSAMLMINPANEHHLTFYDGLRRQLATAVIKRSDYKPLTWQTYHYDNLRNGLLEVTTKDSQNYKKTMRYDGAGRMLASIDEKGQITSFTYDGNNNRLSFRDPNGVGQDCEYDERNRDTLCTDTTGDITRKEYNANNQVIRSFDEKNAMSSMDYDARGRKITMTDRVLATTTYTYDGSSNLLSVTDGQFKTTLYEYNKRNLQTSITYAGHNPDVAIGEQGWDKTFCSYDALQRKKDCIDQTGQKISYTYDLANRMTRRTYFTPTGNANSVEDLGFRKESQDKFNYDTASRLTRAYKGRYNNHIELAYDERGLLTLERLRSNGRHWTLKYRYDNKNRRTYMRNSTRDQNFMSYDSRNQLTKVRYKRVARRKRVLTISSNFTYDAGMREITRSYGNNVKETRSYNLDNTISSISNKHYTLNYDYDENKNVTREESTGTFSNRSWESGFDAQDRLTSWQRFNSNGNEIDNRSWDLSLIGNQDVVTINGQTDNRTYNDTHQLLSKSNRTYEYGIRGYQTKRSTSSSFSSSEVNQKLSWDIDGHLKQVNNASNNRLIAKYAYDALGRRIRKQVFSNSKIAETRIYVNSGNRVADEYQARRGNRFSILRRYVYGNYVDDVVGIIYGSSSFYYHHQDRQYSSRALTNGRGGIVESYSYTPYGERITDSRSQANMLKQSQYGQSIGFTGRYFDSETGLYYFRARYYDTEQGRFISRDPAGYVDGMGLYNGYFASRFLTDPHGRRSFNFTSIPNKKDLPCPCKKGDKLYSDTTVHNEGIEYKALQGIDLIATPSEHAFTSTINSVIIATGLTILNSLGRTLLSSAIGTLQGASASVNGGIVDANYTIYGRKFNFKSFKYWVCGANNDWTGFKQTDVEASRWIHNQINIGGTIHSWINLLNPPTGAIGRSLFAPVTPYPSPSIKIKKLEHGKI